MEQDKLENFSQVVKLNVGSALVVHGKLIMTPQAKQPFEIHAQSIEVEGASTPEYPLQKKRHSLEFLRSIAHLRPRTNTFAAVFRVRSVAAYAIHKFFNERGFVYVHTPLITGSDCEGAGEMFRVTCLDAKNPPLTETGEVDFSQDFFGKLTSLTVSGQLEAECMADVYKRQTGGYILAYPLMALAVAFLSSKWGKSFWKFFVTMTVGLGICYAVGVLQLMIYTGNGIVSSLMGGVVPFIFTDIDVYKRQEDTSLVMKRPLRM